MELRPYQKDLSARALDLLYAGKSVLLQLATAAGKTIIAGDIVRSFEAEGLPVWFVCHRREILDQAHATLAGLGIKAGILAPGNKPDPEAITQVCSVNALPRRLEKVRPPRLIVWDECHHIASPSWSALHERFPDAYHFGLTATPDRLDGIALSPWFDELVIGPSPRELIDLGFLSEFRIFAPTIPDLRGVRTTKGDFQKSDLNAAMDKAVLIGDVVDHYQRIAPGLRALVFAVSVEASQHIVERFRAAGIAASHIDASTPADERRTAVDDLAAGRIKVLSNVEVFTEGFDCPAVDAVILLRPTRSLALYLQMIGRGLRTFGDKPNTIILDHSGLVHMHGMPDEVIEWSLDGRLPKKASGGIRLRRCPECLVIHGWAEECEECGHVYVEADRAIAEVYGHLFEIKQRLRPRPGFEPLSHFCIRLGRFRSQATSGKWIERGLPCDEDGLVDIEAGLRWVDEYIRPRSLGATREGSESQTSFARRLCYHGAGSISPLIKRGLPINSDRSIPIEPALAWVGQNAPRLLVVSGLERKSAFARRVGATGSSVARWIDLGMPSRYSFVEIEAAMEWLEAHPHGRGPRLKFINSNTESLADFARRLGVQHGAVAIMRKRGLPLIGQKFVNIKTALAWVASNYKFRKESPEREIEKTLGLRRGIVRDFRRRGMTCGPGGSVDIATVRDWVENNYRPVDRTPRRGLTARQAGDLAGITNQAMRSHVNKGRIKTLEDGSIDPESFLAWMRKRQERLTAA